MFGNKDSNPGQNEFGQAINQIRQSNAENTGILTILAQDYIKEKKAKRRWGIFFKILVLLYLVALLFAFLQGDKKTASQPHTALVDLSGVIGPEANSSDLIIRSLRRAFKSELSQGVVMRLNSPGGTPVQASEINMEIERLKEKYPNKPFFAVISDICASGCYYVAVASEQIFAHPSSLVGSIGVRMDGFGFVETMRKLGVERRLITAGENKGMLDPFLPVDESVKSHTENMLREVHNQFIDAVKTGRGDRLDAAEDLFSGLVWSGEAAQRLGLVDQFGGLDYVAREVIGQDRVFNYSPREPVWSRFIQGVSAAIAKGFKSDLDSFSMLPN